MKILIYEHLTAGGNPDGVSESLLKEGNAMVEALIRDLSEVKDVELQVLRHASLPPLNNKGRCIQWLPVRGRDSLKALHEAIKHADAVWPIAPETAGVLEHICRMVAQQGKRLIASPAQWIRRSGGKYAALNRLSQNGVNCIESHRLKGPILQPPLRMPFVIKPEDGAGCEGIQLVRTSEDWDRLLLTWEPEKNPVAQPFVEGTWLSLSALFAAGQAVLLSCNVQEIDQVDNGFRLSGLEVNALEDIDGRFSVLAQNIAAIFPGLWGYIGIDLMENAQGLFVMEINPRLTTAYVGLHRALGHNPASWIIDLLKYGYLPSISIKPTGPQHLAL